MLFRRTFLEGIRAGTVTLAFRRWRRPTVRSGGTLLTPVGALEIARVTPVEPEAVSQQDARRAGYDSRSALFAELDRRPTGTLYRIELGRLHPDPRRALQSTPVARGDELRELEARLQRLDARAAAPWTLPTLALLAERPGVRAAELAAALGQQRERFKRNVRKLKSLGLTESLAVGYRLSPRGIDLLQRLRAEGAGPDG